MSDLKQEILEQYIARASRRNFLSVASKVAAGGAVAAVALQGQTTSAGNDLNVLNYALTLEFLEATFYTQFLGPGAPPTGQTSLAGLTGTVTGNPKAFTAADASSAAAFQGFPAAFGVAVFGLLTQIRDHETTHVAALIAAIKSLGGTPTQPCTYNFSITDINSFLTTAQALENTGVSAYDGAINMVSNPMLVQVGATIATVEARHASFLNLIAGGGLTSGNFTPPPPPPAGGPPAIPGVSASPFPTAFDIPLSMAQVLQIATPFLSSCPVPLAQTSVVFAVTPAGSTSAPFTVPQVTIDLGNSISGTGQPLKSFLFSVPGNVAAFCPAPSPNVSPNTPAAVCPLQPAILQSGSSKAIIQFVNGTGLYPVQVMVTDSTGRTATQVLVFAYQAPGGPVLPSGTPGVITAMPGTGK